MALVLCPECQKMISEKAAACPSCGLPMNPLGGRSEILVKKHRLRSIPAKISPTEWLKTDRFRLRGTGKYGLSFSATSKMSGDEWQDRPVWETDAKFRNEFLPLMKGTVSDRATGLMWQQSGYEQTLDWLGANRYILWLNQTRFCGFTDWRLPTIDELDSLYGHGEMDLESGPPGEETYCWRSFSQEFDDRQWMCWSCDMALEGSYQCHSTCRNQADVRVWVTIPENALWVYNFGSQEDCHHISTGVLGAIREDNLMFVRAVRTEATGW